jgi:hypothetical protein
MEWLTPRVFTDGWLMRGFGMVAEGGFALCYSFKVVVGCYLIIDLLCYFFGAKK